jgi:hypothetical protein
LWARVCGRGLGNQLLYSIAKDGGIFTITWVFCRFCELKIATNVKPAKHAGFVRERVNPKTTFSVEIWSDSKGLK